MPRTDVHKWPHWVDNASSNNAVSSAVSRTASASRGGSQKVTETPTTIIAIKEELEEHEVEDHEGAFHEDSMELYVELSDWSPEILPYEQFPADVM